MAYNIKRFDNTTPVVTVADNTIDNTTLAINLIGKNRSSYGEAQNQNFVYLLENFAGSEPPRTALSGQLWYNSANNKLSFNDGNGSASYRTLARLEVSNALPSANSIGDLWFNSAKKELTLWDGTRSIVIGPANSDPTTLIERLILKPRNSTELKNVLAAKVNDTYIYIISSETFEVDSVFNESNDNSLVYNQFPKLYAGITLPTANVFGMFTSNILLSSSTANNGAGTIRYNNGVFEGYNGSNWVNFGGIQGVVAVSNGGTGLQTYSTGDLIYASGSSTLAKRTIGTTGQVLTVEDGIPTWKSPASGLSYPSGTGLVRVGGGSSWGTTINLPNNADVYLNGSGAWSTPASGLSYPSGTGLVRVGGGSSWGTTINLPNNADVYLNGSGAWSTPSSGPSGGISSINISGAGLSSNTLTSNGTLTLSGTLNTANGGTGTSSPGITSFALINQQFSFLDNQSTGIKISGSPTDVNGELGIIIQNTRSGGITGFVGAGTGALSIAGPSVSISAGLELGAFIGGTKRLSFTSQGFTADYSEPTYFTNALVQNEVRGLLLHGNPANNNSTAGYGIIVKNDISQTMGFFGAFGIAATVASKYVSVSAGDLDNQGNKIGFFKVFINEGDGEFWVDSNNVYARNSFIGGQSDIRLKNVIGNISEPLLKINSLNGFYYKFNDVAKEHGFTNDNLQVGLSAQEVQQVLPEIVQLSPFDHTDDNHNSKSGENYLTIQYERLVPLLVEGIKEQTKIIESLITRIEQLEAIVKQ